MSLPTLSSRDELAISSSAGDFDAFGRGLHAEALQSPTFKQANSPDAFARELSRMQEEQIITLKKIEREKKRREMLDFDLGQVKLNLRRMQDKTRNGNIVKDHEISNKKIIGRLEHQLQMSKIKLSVARNENINHKNRIQNLRREKLLHLQILNDLLKEISTARRRSRYCQKEVQVLSEKKMKVKMSVANMKQKMVRDMEDFSEELTRAKESISNTQTSILNTIREKMASTYDWNDGTGETGFGSRPHTRASVADQGPRLSRYEHGDRSQHHSSHGATSIGHSQQDAEAALKETEFGSVEELISALQVSEDKVFALYHETQSRHEEVEKMELENKYLENQVQEQMRRLRELEGDQERVKLELEKNIQTLNASISKYEADYGRNMEVLNGVSGTLLTILRSVAVDEAALDQQLLSTGISDRNVEDFLGLIEQRIDDLIQMAKAANHQAIRREDFLKAPATDKNAGFQAPAPPPLADADDDEDIDEAAGRLQPLNIPMLKEIIHKRVQKMSISTHIRKLDKTHLHGGGSGMRSRNASNSSLRSNSSAKSLSGQQDG